MLHVLLGLLILRLQLLQLVVCLSQLLREIVDLLAHFQVFLLLLQKPLLSLGDFLIHFGPIERGLVVGETFDLFGMNEFFGVDFVRHLIVLRVDDHQSMGGFDQLILRLHYVPVQDFFVVVQRLTALEKRVLVHQLLEFENEHDFLVFPSESQVVFANFPPSQLPLNFLDVELFERVFLQDVLELLVFMVLMHQVLHRRNDLCTIGESDDSLELCHHFLILHQCQQNGRLLVLQSLQLLDYLPALIPLFLNEGQVLLQNGLHLVYLSFAIDLLVLIAEEGLVFS